LKKQGYETRRHKIKERKMMGIRYITLGTNDLPRARRYYDAVLPILGGAVEADYYGVTFCYLLPGDFRLWVGGPHDGKAASSGNGVTIGLAARSEEEVNASHAAALANGGSNEGDPGPRPMYGPQFYGGYARDPDGNKMSFVFFRDVPES
jgi:catechol 2,3-dioxygenase-like lactoylglutathione lyase family enzyme